MATHGPANSFIQTGPGGGNTAGYLNPVKSAAATYSRANMEVMHYSQEWDNAGMPHSIFFTSRGHAVHGSNHPGLGTPVSHGCVRLTLTNASTLYQLVGARGMADTTVIVKGPDPDGVFAPSKPPQPTPRGLFPFGGLFGGSR